MEKVKDILGEDFGEKILDYFKELARGLGVAAEHVYIILVRQQIVLGIAEMIGFLIGIVALSFVIWKGAKYSIKNDSEEFLFILILPGAVIAGFIVGFFDGFIHVFNPEYYAIKEILEAIS